MRICNIIHYFAMLYRILAVMALFFFTACGGGTGPTAGRKPVNAPMDATAQPDMADMRALSEPDAPAHTVKVGLLVPLSGEAASVGRALMDAASLALMDKYGYAHGSADDVRVVLVPKDTGGTPQGAAQAARHVIASGAQLIVGPLFSPQVSAVAPIAKQHGVNVLTFSNNPDIAGNGVFVFGFQVEQQVRRVMNYAMNSNIRSVALLAPNNAYGQSVQKSAQDILRQSGLALAAEQMYAPASNGVAEIGMLATSHAATPFQAVLVPEGGQKLGATVNALRAQRMAMPDVRLLGTGLWDEPSVLRSGAMAGGWFASSPPDRFSAYERRFRENFGYAPPRLSALAYDAMALAASLGMAHNADFSINALTDPVGYNGPVNGIFRCTRDGMCERGLAVLEATGNGARVIDPAPTSF